jgi:3',5'-cyclic AMP phosphodiesterase CpdA
VLAVLGDLHVGLEGSYTPFPEPPVLEAGALPLADADAVLFVGDLADGPAHADAARELVEHVHDERGRPVVLVPGNHDPLPVADDLVAGLPDAVNAHGRAVTDDDFPSHDAPLDGCSVVGWGCADYIHRPDAPGVPEVDYAAVLGIDPETATTAELRAAEPAVGRFEDAVADCVRGSATPADLCERFGVADASEAVAAGVERLAASWATIDDAFAAATEPTVLLAHLPPFNTSLDSRNVYDDHRAVHDGSLALKLACRVHDPAVTLTGHHHNRGYPEGTHGATDMLNVGYRTVTRVDPTGGLAWQTDTVTDAFSPAEPR